MSPNNICVCGHFAGRHFGWTDGCSYHKGCRDVVLPTPDYTCYCDNFKEYHRNPTNMLCKCGHTKEDHEITHEVAGACSRYEDDFTFCGCSVFVLDNLSYIEYLAKQKGLV